MAQQCPPAFYDPDNPWTRYVRKLFEHSDTRKNWIWRDGRADEQAKELDCFFGLFRIPTNDWLNEETHFAIMAWMLSEMLVDVPVFDPPPFQTHGY